MYYVKLKFLGKRDNFIFKNDNLIGKVYDFSKEDRIAEVHPSDVDWIMKYNGHDFKVVGDVPRVKYADDDSVETELIDLDDDKDNPIEEEPEEPQALVCLKCGKQYSPTSKHFYDKHVEKCEG